jgi:hypothetical protein
VGDSLLLGRAELSASDQRGRNEGQDVIGVLDRDTG